MSLQVTSRGHGPDLRWCMAGDSVQASGTASPTRSPATAACMWSACPAMPARRTTAPTSATADALPLRCPAGMLLRLVAGRHAGARAAARHPGHFGRLALVGSTARFVQDDDWPAAQPPELLDTFRHAIAGDARTTLTRFVMLFNQGDTRDARPCRIGR